MTPWLVSTICTESSISQAKRDCLGWVAGRLVVSGKCHEPGIRLTQCPGQYQSQALCFLSVAFGTTLASSRPSAFDPVLCRGIFLPPFGEKKNRPPRSEGSLFKGVAKFLTKGGKKNPAKDPLHALWLGAFGASLPG